MTTRHTVPRQQDVRNGSGSGRPRTATSDDRADRPVDRDRPVEPAPDTGDRPTRGRPAGMPLALTVLAIAVVITALLWIALVVYPNA